VGVVRREGRWSMGAEIRVRLLRMVKVVMELVLRVRRSDFGDLGITITADAKMNFHGGLI
jgi:hypothetical protein